VPEQDKWSRWLAETRFGGDEKAAERGLATLKRVRDTLLAKAGLEDGKVLLDVGAGEGLIAFGAVERVGASGRVIISDISEALLEHCREAAEKMGVLDRCSFVKASAEDLSPIENESVDVVATRSVLIYVDDKQRALKEFFRVLKPGGRTALFEPIDDHRLKDDSRYWSMRRLGATSEETAPIRDLLLRIAQFRGEMLPVNEAMINFNERDLVRMCVDAGFAGVHTEFYLDVWPNPPMRWETVMNSSGNPLIPTWGETLRQIFNDEELARYEKHMRPLIERGGNLARHQSSFTWAFKAPLPKNPLGAS